MFEFNLFVLNLGIDFNQNQKQNEKFI